MRTKTYYRNSRCMKFVAARECLYEWSGKIGLTIPRRLSKYQRSSNVFFVFIVYLLRFVSFVSYGLFAYSLPVKATIITALTQGKKPFARCIATERSSPALGFSFFSLALSCQVYFSDQSDMHFNRKTIEKMFSIEPEDHWKKTEVQYNNEVKHCFCLLKCHHTTA